MKAWKFRLGIAAVFVLGIVVGAAGAGTYLRFAHPPFKFGRPEEAVRHIMKRLDRQLDLTDEQRKAIEPIVAEAFTRMRALRARLTPEVESLIDESTKRIKTHLNPDQQRRLDDYNAEVLKRWRMFAGPGFPPPPGTPLPPGIPPGPPPPK